MRSVDMQAPSGPADSSSNGNPSMSSPETAEVEELSARLLMSLIHSRTFTTINLHSAAARGIFNLI